MREFYTVKKIQTRKNFSNSLFGVVLSNMCTAINARLALFSGSKDDIIKKFSKLHFMNVWLKHTKMLLMRMWTPSQLHSDSHCSTDFFFYPPITATLDFDILFEHTRAFGANAPSSVAFNLQLKLF